MTKPLYSQTVNSIDLNPMNIKNIEKATMNILLGSPLIIYSSTISKDCSENVKNALVIPIILNIIPIITIILVNISILPSSFNQAVKYFFLSFLIQSWFIIYNFL
jgi:hypothetical protein